MTDPIPPGAPEATPEPAAQLAPPPPPELEPPRLATPLRNPPPEPPPRPRSLAMPMVICFLILAGGIAYVGWRGTQFPPELEAMQQRLAQLEQRPAPLPANTADLRPLAARLAALEHRPLPPDIGPLETRVASLEKQAVINSQYPARLDAVSARVEALSSRERTAESDTERRISGGRSPADDAGTWHDADHRGNTAGRAPRPDRDGGGGARRRPAARQPGRRATRRGAVRHHRAADGSHATPRLPCRRRGRAGRRATGAGRGSPFLSRVLDQAKELITVRQGDRVLMGNPSAGVLARARSALDAGDIAGAVAAVSGLTGPPAAAMAWLANAKALLAARAGLADMAAHV